MKRLERAQKIKPPLVANFARQAELALAKISHKDKFSSQGRTATEYEDFKE